MHVIRLLRRTAIACGVRLSARSWRGGRVKLINAIFGKFINVNWKMLALLANIAAAAAASAS